MTPEAIAVALRARGVELHSGRPDFDAHGLAAIGICPLHDEFVAMVRCFDGFRFCNEGYVTMWDIATICAERALMTQPPGIIAFGDYLISSDIVLCDPCDASQPVVYMFEARELAPTYSAFWERLVAGTFDIPPPGLR